MFFSARMQGVRLFVNSLLINYCICVRKHRKKVKISTVYGSCIGACMGVSEKRDRVMDILDAPVARLNNLERRDRYFKRDLAD